MKKFIFLFILFFIAADQICQAACAPTGQIRNNAGVLEFCNGTDWKLVGAPEFVFGGCGANDGKLTYNTTKHRVEFCNNTTLYSTGCSTMADACAGSEGMQRYNTTLNIIQYCDGTNWINMGSLASNPCCPDGFIPVPGDAQSGTQDFCVAKYHMKGVKNNDGVVHDGGGSTGDYYAESRWDAKPWNNIKFNDAVDECAAMGTGYHLITNMEWMTIAKSIENNPVNWSNGIVGSGHIPTGHSDGCFNNTPNLPPGCPLGQDYLAAYNPLLSTPPDPDHDPCSGTGNNNCANPLNNDFWQKRILTLSNGQNIWDFAGNINSWVSPIIATDHSNAGLSISYNKTLVCAGTTCNWELDEPNNLNPFNAFPPPPTGAYVNIYAPAFMYPPNPVNTANKFAFLPANDAAWGNPPAPPYLPYNTVVTPYDQLGFGMTTWISSSNFSSTADRAMYRGGFYRQSSSNTQILGGIYSMWLTLAKTSGDTSVGFRCVYMPPY